VVVRAKTGEDSILGWGGDNGTATMMEWTTNPLYVVSVLEERSAELRGLTTPKRWNAEDGQKVVAGFQGVFNKSLEIIEVIQQEEGREATTTDEVGEDSKARHEV
jgi:hypothetical protein